MFVYITFYSLIFNENSITVSKLMGFTAHELRCVDLNCICIVFILRIFCLSFLTMQSKALFSVPPNLFSFILLIINVLALIFKRSISISTFCEYTTFDHSTVLQLIQVIGAILVFYSFQVKNLFLMHKKSVHFCGRFRFYSFKSFKLLFKLDKNEYETSIYNIIAVKSK
jgi:hypothetical protein